MFIGQFFKGNNMLQLRIHNGRYYAHAQVLMLITTQPRPHGHMSLMKKTSVSFSSGET